MLRVLSVLLGCFLLIVAGSFLTSSASPVTSRDATYEPPPNAVEDRHHDAAGRPGDCCHRLGRQALLPWWCLWVATGSVP